MTKATHTLPLVGVLVIAGFYEVSVSPTTPHPFGTVIGCMAILLGVQQGLLLLYRQFALAELLTKAPLTEEAGEERRLESPPKTWLCTLGSRALLGLAVFVSMLSAVQYSSPDP
eukprot:CAMPEP_0118940200 /NCGR_PEP_ID=MMETSP1169-20130426/30830_1 /TAXON_ID=36882 /ORGANISM="Pyramimonas obovata, Strain CCMP722" /LENGTH=113 /DNA_ID=CAMNT_0006884629 /DNA_START=202 /DNA_END=540 /DNA_ORIENTATION=-